MSYSIIETDLVINGGGFMGLSLAYQAALRGIRSVILEKEKVPKPHYMTGFLASRADYLRLDIDEVKSTAYECPRWIEMFPDIVKPGLFIMPFGPDSPYSYKFIEHLMKLYDQVTAIRLQKLPRSTFRINNMALEQMEPNLRKNYFMEGLGFYELTADPNELLEAFRKKLNLFPELCIQLNPRAISYSVSSSVPGNRINQVDVVCQDGDRYCLMNEGGINVIDAAGSSMADIARIFGVSLPLEYNLGIQMAVPQRYYFQSVILTFADDNKYVCFVQKRDHIQIGPTNTPFKGRLDPDLLEYELVGEYLMDALSNTVESGEPLPKPVFKSAGLRVKLKLPFSPDSNRPFVFNIGPKNFYAVYPGKTILALKTADELLDKIFKNKKFDLCINGDKKIRNILKLNLLRLKSLAILGLWYLRYPFIK